MLREKLYNLRSIIHRLAPKEKITEFEFRAQDFPQLQDGYKRLDFNWGVNQARTTTESVSLNATEPGKAISTINDKLTSLIESWGTRALEAVDLVYKTQASICIFTEVGELWNTSRLPHFNTFYQKAANKNGGVCIAVGKQLKATRVEVNIPNTVVVDITGLSEPVRIIGIYWPASQQRDLDDILSYVIEGTILSGDFNATVKEWNSPVTDRRGCNSKIPKQDSYFDQI
ncbi:unnamed protein product [Rotaria sp. Silwood1]|nr:unnamed protein product [Rotaria sp. Silwood1]